MQFALLAMTQPADGQSPGWMGFVPLIAMFAVFYFLLIRPQQKKAKEHRNMVDNVRRGDEVVTGGGIVGKVTKVKDDHHIQVEIAEGVRINVVKGTLSDVRTKSAPAAADAKPASENSEGGGGIMSKIGLKK